jgi:hypothetical protein
MKLYSKQIKKKIWHNYYNKLGLEIKKKLVLLYSGLRVVGRADRRFSPTPDVASTSISAQNLLTNGDNNESGLRKTSDSKTVCLGLADTVYKDNVEEAEPHLFCLQFQFVVHLSNKIYTGSHIGRPATD